MAVLSYLDFFPAVVQRSAVATAATMAARTGNDTMDAALQAVPRLLPLLDYTDHSIVDSAALALNRITSAAARCDLLAQLSAHVVAATSADSCGSHSRVTSF